MALPRSTRDPRGREDEEWFYLADAGPSRWLKVVVIFEAQPAAVSSQRSPDFDETPEGHAVRFDREGKLVGLTLVRPKRLLERDGELRVTLPVPSDVLADQLASALA